MTLVIGTDEAGYGPNLGPLVVAATAWQVEADADEAEALLAAAVSDALGSLQSGSAVVWRDSKEVYRGGSGRPLLLRSTLAAVHLASGTVPLDWQTLASTLGQIEPMAADTSPEWQTLALRPLLGADLAASVGSDAEQIASRLAAHGVRLRSIQCRCVYPGRFNQLLESGMNKSDILSRETLALAAALAESFDEPQGPTRIWCDRHGGRKRYAGVIAAAFDCQAEVIQETAERSVYRLASGGLFGGMTARDTQLDFAVRSERKPPVAVASLTAKLVRELAMECFNAFWCGQLSGLAPTAGYPVDAARWREQATPAVTRLAVDAGQLWRQV